MMPEGFFSPRTPLRQIADGRGNQTWARELAFEPTAEPFVTYPLMDGGSVRVRITVRRIFQVTDEHGEPQFTPDGSRSLVVHSTTDIISVD